MTKNKLIVALSVSAFICMAGDAPSVLAASAISLAAPAISNYATASAPISPQACDLASLTAQLNSQNQVAGSLHQVSRSEVLDRVSQLQKIAQKYLAAYDNVEQGHRPKGFNAQIVAKILDPRFNKDPSNQGAEFVSHFQNGKASFDDHLLGIQFTAAGPSDMSMAVLDPNSSLAKEFSQLKLRDSKSLVQAVQAGKLDDAAMSASGHESAYANEQASSSALEKSLKDCKADGHPAASVNAGLAKAPAASQPSSARSGAAAVPISEAN